MVALTTSPAIVRCGIAGLVVGAANYGLFGESEKEEKKISDIGHGVIFVISFGNH